VAREAEPTSVPVLATAGEESSAEDLELFDWLTLASASTHPAVADMRSVMVTPGGGDTHAEPGLPGEAGRRSTWRRRPPDTGGQHRVAARLSAIRRPARLLRPGRLHRPGRPIRPGRPHLPGGRTPVRGPLRPGGSPRGGRALRARRPRPRRQFGPGPAAQHTAPHTARRGTQRARR
jgi:hypothetical protein